MPDPDWEARADEAALALSLQLRAEMDARNLLPLLGEAEYIYRQAFVSAVLCGVRAANAANEGTFERPAPAIEPKLRNCQVCGAVPVVVRWYSDAGPHDLCAACDRRRLMGKKMPVTVIFPTPPNPPTHE